MTTPFGIDPTTGKPYPTVLADSGVSGKTLLYINEKSYHKALEALARDPNHVFTYHVIYSVSAQALVDAYENAP